MSESLRLVPRRHAFQRHWHRQHRQGSIGAKGALAVDAGAIVNERRTARDSALRTVKSQGKTYGQEVVLTVIGGAGGGADSRHRVVRGSGGGGRHH